MTRIQLSADGNIEQAMSTVHKTFEAREYHWERIDADKAVASQGGKPVGNAALPLSQRLRVGITIQPEKHRLVLSQEIVGAAWTGVAVAAGGGPWLQPRLSSRFRKIVKAVREDLAAAGWC